MKKNNYLKLGLLAGLFMLTYTPTLLWMCERWMAKDSYYGHGILVPFISGYIVWQIIKKRQEEIKKSAKKYEFTPSNTGLIFIIAGLFIHIISAWMRVYFSSGFSMLLTIAGLILYLGGKQALKTFAFPLAFIIFMLPLPLVAVANISFKMKIFAAEMSKIFINGIGIPAIRSGSEIIMRHSNLMVGDPCSGLRSLISLLALGGLFSYYANVSYIRKTILFAASIPLALASNIARISFLCFMSEVYGPKSAEGLVHDAAGMMVFVLAFIGMVVAGKILE